MSRRRIHNLREAKLGFIALHSRLANRASPPYLMGFKMYLLGVDLSGSFWTQWKGLSRKFPEISGV